MKKDIYIALTFFAVIGVVFTIVTFEVDSIVIKWICGILAFAFFAMTIYIIIEETVSAIRQKVFMKSLLKEFEKKLNDPEEEKAFFERMEKNSRNRDMLFDSQRPEEKDFGYSLSNPIMTSTISYSEKYLKSLTSLDGKPFTWERVGSFCMSNIGGVEHVMVDKYQLYQNGKEYTTLYICPYGHSSPFVPHGLKLKEQ